MVLNSLHAWDIETVEDFWKWKLISVTNSLGCYSWLYTTGAEAFAKERCISMYKKEVELALEMWLEFQIMRDQQREEERAFYRPADLPDTCVDWLAIADEKWLRIQDRARYLTAIGSFDVFREQANSYIMAALSEVKHYIHEFNSLHARKRNLRIDRVGY